MLCDELDPLAPDTSGRAMPRLPQLLRREAGGSKLAVNCATHAAGYS